MVRLDRAVFWNTNKGVLEDVDGVADVLARLFNLEVSRGPDKKVGVVVGDNVGDDFVPTNDGATFCEGRHWPEL